MQSTTYFQHLNNNPNSLGSLSSIATTHFLLEFLVASGGSSKALACTCKALKFLLLEAGNSPPSLCGKIIQHFDSQDESYHSTTRVIKNSVTSTLRFHFNQNTLLDYIRQIQPNDGKLELCYRLALDNLYLKCWIEISSLKLPYHQWIAVEALRYTSLKKL